MKASPEVFTATLDLLAREKNIEAAGDLVRLPGHGVVMKDEEAESKKKIEEAFAVAGLKVPALHEVIAGLKPGRQSEDEITVYKSTGSGFQDAVVARIVYDAAVAAGVGSEVAL